MLPSTVTLERFKPIARQCRQIGELQHWRGARPLEAYELGAVVRGVAPGRQSEAEITVCDLTGVGVQDTAIANRACALAAGAVD